MKLRLSLQGIPQATGKQILGPSETYIPKSVQKNFPWDFNRPH